MWGKVFPGEENNYPVYFYSLIGLRDDKARYGKVRFFPSLPKKVCFSQQREEILSGEFEYVVQPKQEACGKLAEFSSYQGR